MKCRTALCFAVVLIALALMLCGCIGQRQSETGAVSGVVAGQPLVLKWTRDTEGTTSLDIPPALVSALSGAAGATPWGALIAGGASVIAAAVAANRQAAAKAATARADEHKADSDEAWDRLTNPQPASK